MAAYKNVAIFGASGSLGAPILEQLIAANTFNITVITRQESKATFPSGLKVVKADYSSLDSLTKALTGQEAVVSAVGTDGFLGQKLFVEAAIAAGVKRFLPSEFGSDLQQPKIGALAVFGYKQAIRALLKEKAAEGAITYTFVINSGFLDWGIQMGFLLNWTQGKPEIYDGGNTPFSSTTLATVGKAVVSVLSQPEKTKNVQVRAKDVEITQNKLWELAKKANPEKAGKWEAVPLVIKDVERSTEDAIAKGDFSMGVLYGQIKLSIFGGADYGQPLGDDNELLGIKPSVTDEDIVEIWKKYLA